MFVKLIIISLLVLLCYFLFLDKLYVVKYEQFWYRGRVRSILIDSLGVQFYDIFYIDYGNSKVVTNEDLRPMSPRFATQSPFAIKCRLHDIEPSEGKWNRDAASMMNNMLDQKYKLKFNIDLFEQLITMSSGHIYGVFHGKSDGFRTPCFRFT